MKNRIILIIGILLIIGGIALSGYTFYNALNHHNDDEKKIEDFFEIQEDIQEEKEEHITTNESITTKEVVKATENYLGVLEIPSLNITRGFYSKTSKLNNVNKNIKLLAESSMPDEDKGNVIIAGHSGNAWMSYFKNLNKLKSDDHAIIYYKGKTYQYKLVNIYEVEKTGIAVIRRNLEVSTLTLITCKHGTNYQYVFIFELENIS